MQVTTDLDVTRVIHQNRDYNTFFLFSDGRGGTIDLEGFSLSFVALKIGNSEHRIQAILSVPVSKGGKAYLALDPEDTAESLLGSYEYQVVGNYPDGETEVFTSGVFSLKESFGYVVSAPLPQGD